MSASTIIVHVAVATPLSRSFDYLLTVVDGSVAARDQLRGCRVEVSFGRRIQVGVIVSCADKSDVDAKKLKLISRVLDHSPVLPSSVFSLVEWASRYYHCPIGEAISTALPAALRRVKTSDQIASSRVVKHWRLSEAGSAAEAAVLSKAPLQQKILRLLGQQPSTGKDQLAETGSSWRQCISRLCDLGWVEVCEPIVNADATGLGETQLESQSLSLNSEQETALQQLRSSDGQFQACLIEGVTGSGKTEVYLRYSADVLATNKQVLVIVPEIGLTPQLVSRFKARFGDAVVALHSGLNDNQRLRSWLAAKEGDAAIVVGTRSSVFVPFQSLGLIIIDEEHDGSLKQQDGFRYHARDLALVRARNENIPIVLGSATPSLETLHNALTGKYRHLTLKQRAGGANAPTISLLDVRRSPLNEGLSEPLIVKIKQHLENGNQVMLFLNRRGYAPVMLCDACDVIVDCLRCDAHMTVHARSKRMRCHHCGSERPIPTSCSDCGGQELAMAGQGTERIDYALRALFPDRQIVRIDRDTTRRKGSLQSQLEQARSGEAHILVGTQMLAKGHHFPGVTLVALLDVDRGLYGVDFRAAEHMAQTIVQVAGRAGREKQRGEVIIQTRNQDNPLFQTLIHRGYGAFAKELLDERRVLSLPPHNNLALLRAEAVAETAAKEFLKTVKAKIDTKQVNLLGPATAPIERVAGRYRAQLLISSNSRKTLHGFLHRLRLLLEEMRESRKVRWSLDVDPADLM